MSAFVINPYRFVSDNITSFEFLQATTDTANATTYTINNVNFGTADANRRIVIGIASRSTNATYTVSSATIGGVSATILAQNDQTLAGARNVHAYIAADVPTGSSGTVSITMNAGGLRLQISTYRVISNSALVLADDDANLSTGTNSATLTISAENGIVLCAAAHIVNSVTPLSLSGIANTDSNSQVENVMNAIFGSERTTATATQSITIAQGTGNAGNGVLAFGVCLK